MPARPWTLLLLLASLALSQVSPPLRSRCATTITHPRPHPPFGPTAASETRIQTAALSGTRDPRNGPSESSLSELEIAKAQHRDHARDTDSEPPQYPVSDVSTPPRPPPFSSLFAPFSDPGGPSGKAIAHDVCASASLAAAAAPAYTYKPSPESEPFDPDQATARAFHDPVAETKSVLPRDTKGESSKAFDAEPPPAYSEGDSPLQSFTYVMSAAGGASSIITQVQQGGPPINAIGGESGDLASAAKNTLIPSLFRHPADVGADEPIAMDLRYVVMSCPCRHERADLRRPGVRDLYFRGTSC